jgi:uncharacterized protein (DUF1697 family)
VQSGNIVFSTAKQSPAALSKKMEAVILKKFGHQVSVITKTTEEVKQAIQNNPFLKEKEIDISRLYVTFLSGHPQSADLEKLDAIPCGDDRYHWLGDIIFLYLPNGAGESKLANAPFEKYVGVRTTTRNWRTVNKLHLMAGESK